MTGLPVIRRVQSYPVLTDTHNMLGWPHVGACIHCGASACLIVSTISSATYECRPSWPVHAAPGLHTQNVFIVRDDT